MGHGDRAERRAGDDRPHGLLTQAELGFLVDPPVGVPLGRSSDGVPLARAAAYGTPPGRTLDGLHKTC